MLYDGEVQKFDYQFNTIIIIINQIDISVWYYYYFLKEIDILQRRPGYTEAIIY